MKQIHVCIRLGIEPHKEEQLQMTSKQSYCKTHQPIAVCAPYLQPDPNKQDVTTKYNSAIHEIMRKT